MNFNLENCFSFFFLFNFSYFVRSHESQNGNPVTNAQLQIKFNFHNNTINFTSIKIQIKKKIRGKSCKSEKSIKYIFDVRVGLEMENAINVWFSSTCGLDHITDSTECYLPLPKPKFSPTNARTHTEYNRKGDCSMGIEFSASSHAYSIPGLKLNG